MAEAFQHGNSLGIGNGGGNSTISDLIAFESNPPSPTIDDNGVAIAEQPSGAQAVDSAPKKYALKEIEWQARPDGPYQRHRILLQNVNGPCPLLALANVLSLRGQLTFPSGSVDEISREDLVSAIGETILDAIKSSGSDIAESLSNALEMLPKLETGLCVNLRFNDIFSFDNGKETNLFDLLDVKMCHGWVVDKASDGDMMYETMSKLSYNSMMDKLACEEDSYNGAANETAKDGDDAAAEDENDGWICRQFVEMYPQQITPAGLDMLQLSLTPGVPCVLFHNNHFSVVFKPWPISPTSPGYHHSRPLTRALFTLVTDQGFQKESRIVWESFDTLSGGNRFVDSFLYDSNMPPPDLAGANDISQIDLLGINGGTVSAGRAANGTGPFNPDIARAVSQSDEDLALAISLQEEENNNGAGCSTSQSTGRNSSYQYDARHSYQGHNGRSSRPGSRREKSRSSSLCRIA